MTRSPGEAALPQVPRSLGDDFSWWRRDLAAAIRREPLAPLALLTLLAAALRIWLLDMPMRLDEATTFNEYALQPWRITLGKYWATNNHPLFSVFAKLSVDLFGREPWAVRLPALLAGVLLVPISYFAAVRLFSRPAAWFTAVGVAVLAPFVLFSTNARGYALVAVLFLLQWLALHDALTRGRTTSWIVVALAGAAGVYTHLTMVFAYAGNVAWALLWMLQHRDVARQRLWPLVASGAGSVMLAVLLYLPYAYFSGIDALVGNDNVAAKSVAVFLDEAPNLLGRIGSSWTTALPMWMAVAVGLLAAIAVLIAARGPVEGALPLVAVATVVVALGVTLRLPPPRSTLYLLPLVLAALGALAERLSAAVPRRASALVWVVMYAPLGVVTVAHVRDEPVRIMSETGWMPEALPIYEQLQTVIQPGDAIASLWLPRDILRYYYLRDGKGRAPLVPEVCPAGPNTLYLLVRRSETIPQVLTYNRLPVSLEEGAVMLGRHSRYTLWRTTAPADLTCPNRPPRRIPEA